jgi:Secreted repeat of unknown function
MKRIIRSLAPLTILLLLGSVITPPGLAARPASAAFPVKVETNKIMGKLLADSHGRTLYYLKTEKNGKIHCSGSCAGVWPPLLLPKGTKVRVSRGHPASSPRSSARTGTLRSRTTAGRCTVTAATMDPIRRTAMGSRAPGSSPR